MHSFASWNGLLWSGDWLGSLRAWDDTGRCVLLIRGREDRTHQEEAPPEASFVGHDQVVTCMRVWKGRLFTGGYDNVIREWKNKQE